MVLVRVKVRRVEKSDWRMRRDDGGGRRTVDLLSLCCCCYCYCCRSHQTSYCCSHNGEAGAIVVE